MPRIARPPLRSFTVAAPIAVSLGTREVIGTMPVPSSSDDVSPASAVNAAKASRPAISGRNSAR